MEMHLNDDPDVSHARLVLSPLDQEARTEMWGESALGEVRWLHIPKYLALRQQTLLCLALRVWQSVKCPE